MILQESIGQFFRLDCFCFAGKNLRYHSGLSKMRVRGEHRDAEICRLLKAGDWKGMELMFRVYYKGLVVWADTFLEDMSLAEDVVQELFISLWEKRKRMVNDFADGYIDSYLKQAPEDMTEVFEAYKRISTDTAAHARNQKVYDHYVNMMPGAQAVDFEMFGTDGKKYHLSGFKGKAVYIDVWATWCGPCCAEIPHVEKLVEHFAGNKKIEFLSISVDENQAKWRKKLAADKPRWKQFICPDNFDSELCKNYDIDAIPRFLFFDKKGRIISLNAPRPSSPDIIKYIEQHIE